MIARLVLVLLGGLWASLCFWLGLWLTFPSELARDRLVFEVDDRTDGGVALRATGVRPWWLTGASLSDVQLFSVDTTRRRGAEPPPARELLAADKLAARLQLLPLLRGVISVGLGGDLYDGDLTGFVAVDGSKTTVDLLARDLDVSRYPFSGDTWEANLGGRLRARVDMVYDSKEVKDSEGRVRLEFTDFRINSAKVMGFDLPEAVFTEALLAFRVENGRAEVRNGSFVSDTLSAEIDGSLTLNESFGRSRLNLTIDVKLGEELDTLAKLAPGVKDARDDAGVYHFNCLGTVDRPSCRPKSNRRPAASRSGVSSPRSTSPLVGGPDEEPSDLARRLPGGELDAPDDELAKRREERLAERRDRIRKRREERLEAQREPDVLDDPADIDLPDDEEFIDEEEDLPFEEEFDPEFEDDLPPAGDPGFEELPPAGDLEDLGYIDD